jgi:23S rRNA pseudouridine2605 synthase
MRLNKFLSHSGICSRRDADKYITDGRVKINGEVMLTPYILQEGDTVHVDDRPVVLKSNEKLWLFYKPQGLVTTHKDPQERPTVFDEPKIKKLGRVVSVGRLDLNSEGLLLLTNSPTLSHALERPSINCKRCYKVRVYGDVSDEKFLPLKKGVTIDGVNYKPITVVIDRFGDNRNHWLFVTLTEGKNREIRKVMNYLELHVSRLVRVSYGPYTLGSMEAGDLMEVPIKE